MQKNAISVIYVKIVKFGLILTNLQLFGGGGLEHHRQIFFKTEQTWTKSILNHLKHVRQFPKVCLHSNNEKCTSMRILMNGNKTQSFY